MRVAIIGAKDRETKDDQKLVDELIDRVAAAAFDVRFVCTNSWQVGIGQFVRTKCTEKENGVFKHQVIIFDVRTYTHHLSRQEMAEVYLARNAAILQYADVLYYFSGDERKGTAEDLCEKMQAAGRPVKVFAPGDPITLIGEHEAKQALA